MDNNKCILSVKQTDSYQLIGNTNKQKKTESQSTSRPSMGTNPAAGNRQNQSQQLTNDLHSKQALLYKKKGHIHSEENTKTED